MNGHARIAENSNDKGFQYTKMQVQTAHHSTAGKPVPVLGAWFFIKKFLFMLRYIKFL
jgi:hypothetical protein